MAMLWECFVVRAGAVVLVTDSEVEGAEKQEVSGDAQVVEDTVR